MRTVTYGGAVSLDGYLARADHAVDWLMWCDEAAAVTTGYWTTVDTVLMGRKTYEAAVRNGMGGSSPGMAGYVFSRTLAEDPAAGVTVVREDAAEYVRGLKEQDGKGICLMGGGELAGVLFAAGLIDEVGLNVHPVLLGSGVPAFPPSFRQTDLELKECRPFRNGCVYVIYRVRR
ncbi:MAG TPA: dihydrofolate reductase family protein [Urbifossiella sp.]|nr:dihydrofolate reductase family protein [Urbifossiella sp.]